MKTPKLEDLQHAKGRDPFQKKVAEVQGHVSAVVRKTFSLVQSDLDHINAVAVSMAQQRGKVVNASEALRTIIHRDRDGPSGS